MVFWVRIFLIEREKHLFRIAALTIFTSALLLLEVFDFPPIWGVFDAHSIWHLGKGLLNGKRIDIDIKKGVKPVFICICDNDFYRGF